MKTQGRRKENHGVGGSKNGNVGNLCYGMVIPDSLQQKCHKEEIGQDQRTLPQGGSYNLRTSRRKKKKKKKMGKTGPKNTQNRELQERTALQGSSPEIEKNMAGNDIYI